MRADEEIPLAGGDVTDGVVRVGDTVRRPRGAWSEAVAAYLRHLQAAGFDGAPRWHGVDLQGRDILDFVPGDVPSQPVTEAWAATGDVLVDVARLLRRLHAASEGFVPPPAAVWFGQDIDAALPAGVAPDPPADIVSHFDVTPQNVVFRDGMPVALIDFDLARPGSALVDVINTARWWCPLHPPADRDPAFSGVDVVARLALFVDAYGLDGDGRARFVDEFTDGCVRSWHRMKANAEIRGGGWARMWDEGVGDLILRRRAWLLESRAAIETALR